MMTNIWLLIIHVSSVFQHLNFLKLKFEVSPMILVLLCLDCVSVQSCQSLQYLHTLRKETDEGSFKILDL